MLIWFWPNISALLPLFIYFFLNHVFKTAFSFCVTPSLSVTFSWNAFFPLLLSHLCWSPSTLTFCFFFFFFFPSFLEVSALWSQSVSKSNWECSRWQRGDRGPCAITLQVLSSEHPWGYTGTKLSIFCYCIIVTIMLWLSVCSCLCLTRTWKKNQQFGGTFLSFFFFFSAE